jgi:hypothetical protein
MSQNNELTESENNVLFCMYVNDMSSSVNVPFILYADGLILLTDCTDCN